MLVKSHDNNLKLIFNYNKDLINRLKTVPRARYNRMRYKHTGLFLPHLCFMLKSTDTIRRLSLSRC